MKSLYAEIDNPKREMGHSQEETKLIKSELPKIAYIPQPSHADLEIPSRIGNLSRVYCYTNVKYAPSEDAEDIANSMVADRQYELMLSEDSDTFLVSYNGRTIGTLIDRVDMVRDWLKRKDIVRCWLKNCGESGHLVALAFYRDEQARYSYGENKVYKLVRYANQDAQDMLVYYSDGDKVTLTEDTFCEDVVNVEGIGDLPKKAAQRYIDEGAAAAFIDHIDYDDEKDKYIPYVKIYW